MRLNPSMPWPRAFRLFSCGVAPVPLLLIFPAEVVDITGEVNSLPPSLPKFLTYTGHECHQAVFVPPRSEVVYKVPG